MIDDNVEFEVVWDGSMELLPPRESRPDHTWTAPTQQANKNRQFTDMDVSEEDNAGIVSGKFPKV